MWNDLLAAGLVDELHLMVGAGVVGGGTPAFGAVPAPSLRLIDTVRRDGAQSVVLRYQVLNDQESQNREQQTVDPGDGGE